jgi:hypothetical protein
MRPSATYQIYTTTTGQCQNITPLNKTDPLTMPGNWTQKVLYPNIVAAAVLNSTMNATSNSTA